MTKIFLYSDQLLIENQGIDNELLKKINKKNTSIAYIPSYLVSAITLLMRSARNVVSAQVTIIMTFLKFLFPPFVHSSRMLDAVNIGKTVTIHYTTVFYSSFSVSS